MKGYDRQKHSSPFMGIIIAIGTSIGIALIITLVVNLVEMIGKF